MKRFEWPLVPKKRYIRKCTTYHLRLNARYRTVFEKLNESCPVTAKSDESPAFLIGAKAEPPRGGAGPRAPGARGGGPDGARRTLLGDLAQNNLRRSAPVRSFCSVLLLSAPGQVRVGV